MLNGLHVPENLFGGTQNFFCSFGGTQLIKGWEPLG
jgi:hypothetical protein